MMAIKERDGGAINLRAHAQLAGPDFRASS